MRYQFSDLEIGTVFQPNGASSVYRKRSSRTADMLVPYSDRWFYFGQCEPVTVKEDEASQGYQRGES